MKLMTKTMIATAAIATMAMSAQASFGDLALKPYAGVKVGAFDVDATNAPNLTSYGVYGGVELNENFGIEADFSGTNTKDLKNTSNIEMDGKNYGLYGTYRYNLQAAPVYVKAKLGVAKTDLTLQSTLTGAEEKLSETRAAGGIGAGYNLTDNISAEVMYNRVHSDVNNYTAGLHFKF